MDPGTRGTSDEQVDRTFVHYQDVVQGKNSIKPIRDQMTFDYTTDSLPVSSVVLPDFVSVKMKLHVKVHLVID